VVLLVGAKQLMVETWLGYNSPEIELLVITWGLFGEKIWQILAMVAVLPLITREFDVNDQLSTTIPVCNK